MSKHEIRREASLMSRTGEMTYTVALLVLQDGYAEAGDFGAVGIIDELLERRRMMGL